MNVELLISTSNDIGNYPDMFHPNYGWIRVDGVTTKEGLRYFKDQMDKTEDRLDNMKDQKGMA